MQPAIRSLFLFLFTLAFPVAQNSVCNASDTNTETGTQVRIQLVGGEEICGELLQQTSKTVWIQYQGEITTLQQPVATNRIVRIVVQHPAIQTTISVEKLLQEHGVTTIAELVHALLF